MVHVSKKYLEENLKREIWSRFAREISQIKSGKQAEQLLEKLFTPSERIMLEKRLAIIHLIERDFKYKEISEMIDVSSSTISFIRSGSTRRAAKKGKSLSQVRLRRVSPKFKKRRFPTYKGRGRWDFMTNPL